MAASVRLRKTGEKQVLICAAAILSLICMALTSYAADPVSQAWEARYNGTASRNNAATAVATDAAGNVYVTGTSSGGVSNQDITTVKYDLAGNLLWTSTYNHGSANLDYAVTLALDAFGNIYVAGQTRASADYYYDTIIIKLDPAGNRLWVAQYNGLGNMDDRPKGLAVDGSGNVIVTIESDSDIVTIKYDTVGSLLWTARYNGPSNGSDRPNHIIVDAAGNVYVTGVSEDDMITIKYGPDGSQFWTARYNGPSGGQDVGNHLALDAAGNVYVAGESYGAGTVYDYVTVKYDSAGNELWDRRYDDPDHLLDEATFVAVNGSGEVIVVGNSYYRYGSYHGIPVYFGPQIATLAYDSSGNLIWSGRYQATNANGTAVSGLSLDAAGNIYISGWTFGSPGFSSDYIVVKYDPAGNILWDAVYDGTAGGDDFSSGIALDSLGNAYITGESRNAGSGADFATLKYDTSGSRLWVATLDNSSSIDDRARHIALHGEYTYVAGDSSLDSWNNEIVTVKYDSSGNQLWAAKIAADTGGVSGLQVDSAGNVCVAGTVNNDIVVIKYDEQGNQLWMQGYNGPDNANDGARGLAVDRQGNIYVTGWSGVYLGSDIVTIKYDPSGNRLWVARTTGGYGEPSAIAVDAAGNVLVTGHIQGGGVNAAYSTLKYDTSGNPLWVSHYVGYGMANALALDTAGNVYVTGSRIYDRTRDAMTTIKYDASGRELWVSDSIPPRGINEGFAIAVDPSGNVYVAGSSNYYGADSEMLVLKYDLNGNQLWESNYSTGGAYEQASALVLDSGGNIYVTGKTDGGGTGSEYRTLKYQPDGTIVWTAAYNGTGNGNDAAAALAVDSSGNVYVTGDSLGQGTGADFVTIKYQQSSASSASGSSGGGGGGGGCFITAVAH